MTTNELPNDAPNAVPNEAPTEPKAPRLLDGVEVPEGYEIITVATGPNPDGLAHQAELAHATDPDTRAAVAQRLAARLTPAETQTPTQTPTPAPTPTPSPEG